MPKLQVAVRCRPALPHEAQLPACLVQCSERDNTVRIVNSSHHATTDKSFHFDRVLSESATQHDVLQLVLPLIDATLRGVHATVFAYGQTGSGKTFTMEGIDYATDGSGRIRAAPSATPKQRHGVIPRTIEALFEHARKKSAVDPNFRSKIKCSFMQLYNEKIGDLLNPADPSAAQVLKDGLRLKWNRNNTFSVENLYTFECDTAEQAREIFVMGLKNKAMGSHLMNTQSSRSHCIFTLHVHSWDAATPESVIKSDLSLVDLAGSEKLAMLANDPSPQLLKESIDINTSLLALGKVITALASKVKTHVPYRDSKLTKLLQHALGGNSMTVMIACISPLDGYVDETMSTLMYAGRARNITNEPKVNEDPRTVLIRQLREEIASLKQELEQYRELVASGGALNGMMSNGGGDAAPSLKSSPMSRAARADERGGGVMSTIGGSATEHELAEKLAASCTMMQKVMQLNTQLRDAFDKIAEAKRLSDAREIELNAENLSLRERIEMLESIVLAPDPSSEGLGSSNPSGGGGSMDTAAFGGRGASQPPSTAWGLATSPPPPSARQAAESKRASADTVAAASAPSAASKYSQGATAAAATKRAPSPKPQPTAGNGGGGSKVRFDDLRLSDYQKKYRAPQKASNYEDYYGEATRQLAAADRGLGAQAAARRNESVSEIESLMRKLPTSTVAMIPSSLQSTGGSSFGSLAFGGTTDMVQDLEERRRQRELRRQQLENQHRQLQMGFSAVLQQPSSSSHNNSSSMPSHGGLDSHPASSAGLGTSSGGNTRLGTFGGGLIGASAAAPPTFSTFVHARGGRSTGVAMSLDAGDVGGPTGKMFQHLTTEDALRVGFTPQQLERLQQRRPDAHAVGNGGGAASYSSAAVSAISSARSASSAAAGLGTVRPRTPQDFPTHAAGGGGAVRHPSAMVARSLPTSILPASQHHQHVSIMPLSRAAPPQRGGETDGAAAMLGGSLPPPAAAVVRAPSQPSRR